MKHLATARFWRCYRGLQNDVQELAIRCFSLLKRTKSGAKTITRNPAWFGPAVHPGEMLLEEFLKPLVWTQVEAAERLGVSVNRLNEIVLGWRGVTADTALRLARCFSTTPRFWMHLQADWDLHNAVCRGTAA